MASLTSKAFGATRARVSVRSRSTVRVQASSSRPLWLPDAKAPAHLNGSLAGDSGFDPLGLGQDADRLKWCVNQQTGVFDVANRGNQKRWSRCNSTE